jgi:N-acetylglucosamine-1-phosphodiester alpha-N-acetylglucosaminidase
MVRCVRALCVVCSWWHVAAALAEPAADYELVAGFGSDPGAAARITKTVLPDAGGNVSGHLAPKADGYLATVENGAPHFRALGPLGGSPCGVRTKTSETAGAAGCRWAVNGGPFNMTSGACDCGVFVANRSVLGGGGWGGPGFFNGSAPAPMFGVTSDHRWVVGVLNGSAAAALDVTWALPGFYWLVRGGRNVAGNSTYRAPRTAVGVDAAGRLLLLEVDGCEPQKGCKFELGRTDADMGALLVQLGAVHAINLDGGGSSTAVEDGKVINRPTSTDQWLVKLERKVTTIVCVL